MMSGRQRLLGTADDARPGGPGRGVDNACGKRGRPLAVPNPSGPPTITRRVFVAAVVALLLPTLLPNVARAGQRVVIRWRFREPRDPQRGWIIYHNWQGPPPTVSVPKVGRTVDIRGVARE